MHHLMSLTSIFFLIDDDFNMVHNVHPEKLL